MGSKENLNKEGFDYNRVREDLADLDESEVRTILTNEEKRFLLYVEKGDVASVRHILKKFRKEQRSKPGTFSINCVDPLGRSGLAISVENENMNMIELLLSEKIEPGDSLLYAINEEYVEGVEVLLNHEEKVHKPGEPYSWQRLEGINANYTPDITPLILAAHKNNYEILKLLLDRGASLPMPHDIKCGCDECVISTADDSLRHSLSRINAYRALSSSSLICLSSTDPLVTSFALTSELGALSRLENEFKDDYLNLRSKVTDFAKDLIENTRTSFELEIVLNYDPNGPPREKGQPMHLTKLREAVESRQKKFVGHANVQQLLGTVWFDGMPGFRRLGPIMQLMQVAKIGMMFPVYCMALLFAPKSKYGRDLTKPFVKFIVHSSAYAFFLMLLVVVSLRVETLLIEFFGTEAMLERLREQQKQERGAFPSIVESTIIIFILGFLWGEICSLWEDGLIDYIKDLWNIIDFITNFFYVNWICMRFTAWFQTKREIWAGINPYEPRETWHPFDPMLISEGMFGAGNIFSFLKLVHIFSVHPHLGPLQIALGRMVFDIIKFFFIYTLVLFAFGCGLNQMLWYYADMDKQICYSLPGGLRDMDQEHSCEAWRRFSNLFETSQSLFWASFGLVDVFNFDLTGIKPFTRFWGLLMFGSYNVINVIVLLNLLIAMMSNSYAAIVEKCDIEWKFARSKLWMSYFEEGTHLPPPFNLMPSPWTIFSGRKKERTSLRKQKSEIRDTQYQKVIRNLVRRYITKVQMKMDDTGVKEDDINEVKQDISTFKHELLNILRINGIDTGTKHHQEDVSRGKKQQAYERRLKKGFNIGMVEGIDVGSIFNIKKKAQKISFTEVFMKILHGKKDKWPNISKSIKCDPIGSSRTSFKRQSLRTIRRRSPWNRVQFYVRRGVFTGGNINPQSLSEAKTKMRKEIRRPPIGWRKIQNLTYQGRLAADKLKVEDSVPDLSESAITINPQENLIPPSPMPSASSFSSAPTPDYTPTPSPSLNPKEYSDVSSINTNRDDVSVNISSSEPKEPTTNSQYLAPPKAPKSSASKDKPGKGWL